MRSRLCLLTLAVVLVASVAGASHPATAGGGASPADGDFARKVAIGGGRELYLACKGSGSPTVVLDSGIHDSSDTWTITDTEPPVLKSPAVFPGVARFTRVCRYDRPGTVRYTGDDPKLTTRSTPVEMPRALPELVSDLRTLLRKAGIRGPYVLVGHSFGGMIVRLFAQTHASEVSGLVFVDAFGSNIRDLFGSDLWPRYAELLNHPGIPLDSDLKWETFDVDGAIDAVLQAPALPDVPLAVMSKTEPFGTAPGVPADVVSRLEEVWPQVQDELVTLEPQTPHILATGSDHYVQVHDPDLTISTIRLIVERVRGGR